MSRSSGPEEARAADTGARALAQSEFAEPLVLEAGAGTGKTTVLVGRIAGWALGPGWERAERERPVSRRAEASAEEIAQRVLRGVVAITFTEAAAAEMAARVGELLRAVARGVPPESFASRTLPADPGERARRAGALLGCLDALTVCTIHAWCHRILREHPIEAGVHPHFEVDANETRYGRVVREVVEAKLAQALADPGDVEFVALAARVGPPDLEAALRVLVRDGVPPEALAADPFEPDRIRAFSAELEGRLAALAELAEGLRSARGERSRSTVRAVDASLALLREGACETRPALDALLERLRPLWDEKDVERLGSWARQDLGKEEAGAVGPHAAELGRRADRLRRAVVHALRIDPELLDLARRVLQPLLAEASGWLRTRGIETYAALLRDARDLVVRRPEIAARIRRRIDQLLVDEFQDTDGIQCDLLAAIALAGLRQERPVLFLVGDPKQSIYGWRNADLRAYEQFVCRIEAEAGERRRLVVNFRSVPGILDEVERLIAPVMERADGLQPPFVPLVPCEARRELPGFRAEGFAPVEHWVTWTRDDSAAWQTTPRAADAAELEARALAQNLLALRDHGVSWRDVALLFRSTGDFDTYLSALRDAAIPYVVERDRSYYRRREIIDAQAWLRCVVDPNDHLALVAWLRSPALGVPDAALLPLWLADLPLLAGTLHGEDAELLDRIRVVAERVAAEISGEIPGIERVRGWEQSLLAGLRALARARAWLESEAPDVFAERARRLFAFEVSEAARHLGVYRVANLDRWLRRLVASLEESGGNVAALLAELRGAVAEAREEEEGRPRDAAENAVHVLTIHKAKGLDFAHVYLLQHQKGAGRGRDEEKARVVARGDRFEYWLLRAEAATPGFEQAALDAKAVEEAERVRTLYVATTRAKERLVVSGAWLDREARAKRGGRRERSHAQLLAARDPEPPDLEELAESLAADRPAQEHGGARWFFPALVGGAEDDEAESQRALELPGAAHVRRESEALLEARARARERALRPFAAVASARVGKGDDEADSAHRYAEEAAPGETPRLETVSPERARAVGTAVHRALELLDPDLEPDAALRESSARAGEMLALLLGPGDREAALASALEILERFVRGPLFARLRELAPHVVARELPVLLSPERSDAGPVGFVSGAIDLVYRDPTTGELVVVDYKTDRVEKPSEIAERAESYAAQGAEYQRALREALALDAAPRFELWFLHAGHREIVGA